MLLFDTCKTKLWMAVGSHLFQLFHIDPFRILFAIVPIYEQFRASSGTLLITMIPVITSTLMRTECTPRKILNKVAIHACMRNIVRPEGRRKKRLKKLDLAMEAETRKSRERVLLFANKWQKNTAMKHSIAVQHVKIFSHPFQILETIDVD